MAASHSSVNQPSAASVSASLSGLSLNDTDATIFCAGQEFKAHRSVLCAQSPVLESLLSGDGKTRAQRRLDLANYDPDVFKLFLQFLYTGSYSDGTIIIGEPADVTGMSPEAIQEHLSKNPASLYPDMLPARALSSSENVHEGMEGVQTYDLESEVRSATFSESLDSDYDPDAEVVEEDDDDDDDFEDEELDDAEDEFRPQRNTHMDDGTEIAKVADARNDLVASMRLYIMADELAVPALKLLARDRFYREAEVAWASEPFAHAVDELYSAPVRGDGGLRDIVCQIVGGKIQYADVRDKMAPLIEKHAEFAAGVLAYQRFLEAQVW